MAEHTRAQVLARIADLAPFAAAGDGNAQRDIAMLRAYADLLDKWAKSTVHCENCGGDYVATGLEVGCTCGLVAVVKGLLAAPYGCSLCDSGKTRNPAKGHQPDCPYMKARKILGIALPEDEL